MSAPTMTVAQLSNCSEEDFDKSIKEMSVKGLMDTISALQKEMAGEQVNFNSLSENLQGMRDRSNSRQYKQISKEIMTSQTTLTLLMNRSMKCFAQQNIQQGKQGVQPRRRNSLKGLETSPGTKSSTPVQRSKSMYVPNPQSPPSPTPPTTQIFQSGGGVQIKKSVNVSKTSATVLSNGFTANHTPASARLPSASDSSSNCVQSAKVVSAGVKTQNNSVSSTDEELQSLPSVKQLAQNFGAFKKSNAPINQKSTAPTKVTLRSNVNSVSQSAKSYISVSNGIISSSKSQGPVTINGEASPERHVVSTMLTFNPVIGQRSNMEVKPNNTSDARPRSWSASRETTPTASTTSSAVQNVTSSRIVTVISKEKPSVVQNNLPKEHTLTEIDNTIKTTRIVNGNSSTNLNKNDYQAGPNKESLLKEIVSHRKDDDSELSNRVPVEEVPVHIREENGNTTRILVKMEEERPRSDSGRSSNSSESENATGVERTGEIYGGEEGEKITSVVIRKDVLAASQSRPDKPIRMKLLMAQGGAQPSGDQEGNQTKQNRNSVEVLTVTQPEAEPSERPRSHSMEGNTSSVDQSQPQTVVSVSQSQPQPQPQPQPQTVVSVSSIGKSQPPSVVSSNRETLNNTDGVSPYLDEDEEVSPSMNLRNWDPSKLLQELYAVKLMDDSTEDISHQFVSMEGFMEKLPMNKKKATLLKTWKRRFFRACNGWLYYYESNNHERPSDTVQLMGGRIEDLGNRILGIDDGRGRFLMVRCPSDKEYGQWKLALDSQTADNAQANYVQPVMWSSPHPQKKVIIIDMGSSSIRAGIFGEKPSLPHLFFPSVVAVNKTSGAMVVGSHAYKPDIRHSSTLLYPISPSNRVDKFNIDKKQMPAVFNTIFKSLGVNPTEYLIMLSTPQSLGDNLRKTLMEILVDSLRVIGVCMVQQSLLSLYSYSTTSGIIVDIGQRIEILPIYDGFVIEGGVAHLPYGAQKMEDSLQISLLSNNYKFSSTVERFLVRYIMEKTCFVAANFKDTLSSMTSDPNSVATTVCMDQFELPKGAYMSVDVDLSRFKSPEGLFDTDMWEMDYPNLHKLVFAAIQACPMDSRRHMFRSIYLSGGVTMLPGFADRLQAELTKLAPPSVPVEVHAAPQRYHAAYIGACSVASMNEFEHMCISRDEWKKEGVRSFKKWKAPSS